MNPKPVTITHLEMLSPAELNPRFLEDPKLTFSEARVKQWQFNRFLYLLVGGDWSWTDRRSWSDAQWGEYVAAVRTFVACYDGTIAGYYELRPDNDGGVEIAILGLTPAFIGRGLGGALLTNALEQAWRTGAKRVWLHTCTLDHPAALPNYLARGMRVCRVETIQS